MTTLSTPEKEARSKNEIFIRAPPGPSPCRPLLVCPNTSCPETLRVSPDRSRRRSREPGAERYAREEATTARRLRREGGRAQSGHPGLW